MLIIKTPLRISIAGGGTDVPLWYREHGSMFISAAIDKFIYTTFHRSDFSKKIRCRYSKMEEVDSIDEIENRIIKETFKRHGVKDSVEITSHAEIPSGTGLGSSGSFGVGVLQALFPYMNGYELGKEATRIQMDFAPIGFQDQMIAGEGVVRRYVIKQDGFVKSEDFDVKGLDEKLVMFYTGIKRDANEVLKKSSNDGLVEIQTLAYTMQEALESKEYDWYGKLLNIHWEEKKRRGGMTSPEIDSWYDLGMKNGALGGKLIGAGGGGFLMFYTNDRERLIKSIPLKHINFKFYAKGSEVLHED